MNVLLSELILPHVEDKELAQHMAAFYAEADAAIAAHRPSCWNRGACCKFETFGHKLYVTSAELAYFVRGNRERWRPPGQGGACPYQVEGLCTAREHRPLGCRIFFCDPDAQDWQGPECERRLEVLKQLCEQLGIAYQYVEWLSGLADLSAALQARERGRT